MQVWYLLCEYSGARDRFRSVKDAKELGIYTESYHFMMGQQFNLDRLKSEDGVGVEEIGRGLLHGKEEV